MGTIMELGFTRGDNAPADVEDKTVALEPLKEPVKQSWVSALAVLFTFSAASALVQLLIGLLEAKANILAYGSKSAPLAISSLQKSDNTKAIC